MKPYPHRYLASASGRPEGAVTLAAPSLASLPTAAPPEFDGPGGLWGPEALLTATIADCIVLTFRAMASASHFKWNELECHTEGELNRIDGITQFSRFATIARLTIPAGASEERARRLLEKAERDCPVANSLRGLRTLQIEVIISREPETPLA